MSADWIFNLAAAPESQEVMLAITRGGMECRVLACRAWFPVGDKEGERVEGWASTFSGEKIGPEWGDIYAWTDNLPTPPDPAEAG